MGGLTKAEQQELDSLRVDLGFGGSIGATEMPTVVSPEARKLAQQAAAESLPMVGSIGATLLAPEVGIPARMAISGAGAGVGDIAKQAWEKTLGRPISTDQFFKELATETGIGALGEGAGQLLGRGLSKAGQAIAETGIGQRLFGTSADAAADLANKQEVQRLLQRYGATLGTHEAEPSSTLLKITERASRVGPTKAASTQDAAMREALSKEVSSLADKLTSNVLSREETGNAVLAAQKEGRTALYDDYGTKLGSLMDSSGATPVNMLPVQNVGKNALATAQKVLREGASADKVLGTQGAKEAENLLAFKDNLTFQEANQLRSTLLEKQRELEKGTPAYNVVKQAIEAISTSMDSAAETASPALKQQYKDLQAYYKTAVKELDPQVLANTASKAPEKIADSIIQNKTVTPWKDTVTMLNRAKALGVNTDGLAENIQRAYLERTFADGGITNVANKLKDKAFNEQFEAVLPQAVKNRAKVVANAGEILGQRGKAIDLATAGAVAGASGAAAGYVLGDGDLHKASTGLVGGELVGLVLAPKIAAKIVYSPALTNRMLAASRDASRGNEAAAAAKLAEMYREIVSSEPIQPKQQTQQQQGTPSSLSEADQQELMKLRQELGQ